ncbi:unnamed protein product [Thlaspi arvense]|uniref:KIB1-4 beta-propeller domain-containing protein n=1 Tax=Thlaspi arvense TaxID=13288 RepID=A0AAU9RV11_THLAR|nr:unnamed protein product [Thlaspi arvense]
MNKVTGGGPPDDCSPFVLLVDFLHFRSICTSWRSSVSLDDNPFPRRPLIDLNPLVITIHVGPNEPKQIFGLDRSAFLSRATFFRVSSSATSRGWLMKCDSDLLGYRRLRLLNPLSRLPMSHLGLTIDLLNVSDIQDAYVVQIQRKKKKEQLFGFKRLVVTANGRLLGVGCDGKIRYWNGDVWTKMKEQVARFCDIIVERERGLTYTLDSHGNVWWVSSSLGIFRYGPSLDEYATKESCRDLVLVECGGELYVVDRVVDDSLWIRKSGNWCRYRFTMIHDDDGDERWVTPEISRFYPKTVGFKVYKVDEEVGKWVQVMSLGDHAFVMASDACFSVFADEFYGCLKNAIYFSDEAEPETTKVFKLDDGSITTMTTRYPRSFRSVCRSWRSSAFDNPFRSRPLIELKLLDPTENASQQGNAFLSGAAFFRVTPSSSPNQGWLIKSDTDLNSGKFRLLDHFSRIPLKHRCKSINLLRFNVSEIQEAYVVHDRRMDEPDPGFKRVVLATVQGGDHALGVGWDGRIRFWSGRIWTILKDQLAEFTDVVIHGGLTYALASDGSVWWISSSLSIFKYGPPLDESITGSDCRNLSFVQHGGELYIVDRILKEGDTLDPNVFYVCAVDDDGNQIGETSPKTIGFKVYKMDEDMGKWVEVKSLGDDAFVMATDTCFSVSAGCSSLKMLVSQEPPVPSRTRVS